MGASDRLTGYRLPTLGAGPREQCLSFPEAGDRPEAAPKPPLTHRRAKRKEIVSVVCRRQRWRTGGTAVPVANNDRKDETAGRSLSVYGYLNGALAPGEAPFADGGVALQRSSAKIEAPGPSGWAHADLAQGLRARIWQLRAKLRRPARGRLKIERDRRVDQARWS